MRTLWPSLPQTRPLARGAAARDAAVDENQRNQNVAAAQQSGLLRSQVRAEAIEARWLGLLGTGEGRGAHGHGVAT